MMENPKRLRARADELRAMADVIVDPTARATMRRVAEDYDQRAARAEKIETRHNDIDQDRLGTKIASD
jgi:hypothetical protein